MHLPLRFFSNTSALQYATTPIDFPMDEKDVQIIRKDQFPQLKNCIYLNHCKSGTPPADTLKVVDAFIQGQQLRLGSVVENPHQKACLQEAAKLINADECEIGLLRSTSEGVGGFAQMLNLQAGDAVIVNDLEFFANIIPWKILAKSRGITVKIVHHRSGCIQVSDIKEQIDAQVKVIVISSVQEVNGFRCDLAQIGALAKKFSIHFVVDGIQQLGAIDLDVKECNVDILICGGHKWLLSPFGTGFFYVRRELISKLHPHYLGWLNVASENWQDHGTPGFSPIRDYEIRKDSAMRFMISATDIIPGIPALWNSLKFINTFGIKEIQKRIFELTGLLIEKLQGKVKIVSPLNEESRSGMVTVRTNNDARIVKQLNAESIYVSTAYASGTGGIRIAPHFFNTEEEIHRFSKKLKELI